MWAWLAAFSLSGPTEGRTSPILVGCDGLPANARVESMLGAFRWC